MMSRTIGNRRAENEQVRRLYPNLAKAIDSIRSKALILIGPPPPYSIDHLFYDLFCMVYRWKRAGRLHSRLRTMAKLSGVRPKTGGNKFLPLVRAASPLDRRERSRIAGRIKKAVTAGFTPAELKRALGL